MTVAVCAPAMATETVTPEWRTVRCENERCKHIVFRYRRETDLSGGVVIEVKCACNTFNRIRLTPRRLA